MFDVTNKEELRKIAKLIMDQNEGNASNSKTKLAQALIAPLISGPRWSDLKNMFKSVKVYYICG